MKTQPTKLSKPERCWAIVHPFVALQVRHIAKKCSTHFETAKKDERLDTYINGGKLDAYRHVFYMAAFSQKLNARKIKKLGLAHEEGNYRKFKQSKSEDGEIPDSLSSVMDLQNNELGIELGKSFESLNYVELSEIIFSKMEEGQALIVKRHSNGSYLTCDDQLLILTHIKKTWFVPKCLVPSNFRYP